MKFFSVVKLYWYCHIFMTNMIEMRNSTLTASSLIRPIHAISVPITHIAGVYAAVVRTLKLSRMARAPQFCHRHKTTISINSSIQNIIFGCMCTHSKLLNSLGGHSRQSTSSEPSPQSLSVSQRQLWGMQRWLEQVNWLAGHVPGTGAGHLDSSLLSKQSLCPSQRHRAGTQRLLAQVNAVGEQVLSAKSKRGSERLALFVENETKCYS